MFEYSIPPNSNIHEWTWISIHVTLLCSTPPKLGKLMIQPVDQRRSGQSIIRLHICKWCTGWEVQVKGYERKPFAVHNDTFYWSYTIQDICDRPSTMAPYLLTIYKYRDTLRSCNSAQIACFHIPFRILGQNYCNVPLSHTPLPGLTVPPFHGEEK